MSSIYTHFREHTYMYMCTYTERERRGKKGGREAIG